VPTLSEGNLLTSGISVWRNTNENSTFEYDASDPTVGDTFIPLAGTPTWAGEAANPYSRCRITLSLSPRSPDVVLPDHGPIEGKNRYPTTCSDSTERFGISGMTLR